MTANVGKCGYLKCMWIFFTDKYRYLRMKYKACNNIYVSFHHEYSGHRVHCKDTLLPASPWGTQTAFMFGHSWLLLGETQLALLKAKPRCVSGFSLVQELLIVGAVVETASSFLPSASLPQAPYISAILLRKAWRSPRGQPFRTCRISPRCCVLLKQAFNKATHTLFYFGHFEPEKSHTNK